MSGRLLWPELGFDDRAEGWLPDVPRLTASQMIEAVARRHPMDGYNGMPGRWVFVREVQASTGAYGDVQRFDAVAVGLVPSTRYARVVYEIKVTRGDWLRELRPIPDVRSRYNGREHREPAGRARRIAAALVEQGTDSPFGLTYELRGEYRKWDAALAVSSEFWVAAPPRCVQLDELPPEAGLLEVRLWGAGREPRARIVRKAPVRETPLPDEGFWAAVLRRAAERRPEAVA